MKQILTITSLLVSIFSFAQEKYTISGVISDKSNGETLIGAAVYAKGTTIGTITNEYGFYSLTLEKGNQTLTVSYIGYDAKEKEISLTQNHKINFELDYNSQELEEVVIKAENQNISLDNAEMSIAKLQSNTIEQIPPVMGESDVIKTIQLLPGVSNAGESASGFNVRGGAEDQNLIMLDEAVVFNSSHLFGFFSVFNTDAIKDMKLYKGGIPAKYGGRVSSVLDIRQKDGNSKEFQLTGAISPLASRLTLEAPLVNGKGSFLVAGRSSYIHLLMKMSGEDSNTAYFYDLNLKANYTINERNRIYLSSYLGDDNIQFANVLGNRFGNQTANFRWNHIFTDKLFSNVSLISSQYFYKLEIANMDMKWESFIRNYNAKLDLKYYASDNLTLDFGANTLWYDFEPGNVNPIDSSSPVTNLEFDNKYALETGVYLNAEHKLSNKLNATYGLRYSLFNRLGNQTLPVYTNDMPVVYDEETGSYQSAIPIGQESIDNGESIALYDNFEPRLSLSYQLTSSSAIKASYNRMSQYLHLMSNTISATPLDVWTPSGSFIKPQLADQLSVGYFRDIQNGKYSFEMEAYYKDIQNRVDYIDGAELIAQNYLETQIVQGEAKSYGTEVLLKKNSGDLTGWIAYTYSKSKQRTEATEIGGPGINNGEWYYTPFDRTHDLSVTGNYKMNDKWSFGANFAFQTGRPTTYPNGQYEYMGINVPTYSTRNSDRLPSYHRLDLSATLIPKKNTDRNWDSEWVFSVYNIYNRNNASAISFGQNLETGLNEATMTYIFGAVPSVSYNFKF
jgi:hypothetical protein